MPATFTEVLDTTPAAGPAALDFTPGRRPGSGTLTVKQRRSYVTYRVAEFPTGWAGRAVRLEKAAGSPGTDAGEPGYDVFVGRNGQDHACSCKGHARWGRCKHVGAVRALVANGWLDLTAAATDGDDRADPFA